MLGWMPLQLSLELRKMSLAMLSPSKGQKQQDQDQQQDRQQAGAQHRLLPRTSTPSRKSLHQERCVHPAKSRIFQ